MAFVPFLGVTKEQEQAAIDEAAQNDGRSFARRAWDGAASSVGNFVSGATAGLAEQIKEERALRDVAYVDEYGNATPKEGYTQEDVDAQNELTRRAQTAFTEETVKPVVIGGAMLGGGAVAGARAAGATIPEILGLTTGIAFDASLPFMFSDAEKSYSEGGVGQVARDFTYGGVVDFATQESLGEQWHNNPIATTVNGILGVAPPLLIGHAVVRAGRGALKARTERARSEIVGESVTGETGAPREALVSEKAPLETGDVASDGVAGEQMPWRRPRYEGETFKPIDMEALKRMAEEARDDMKTTMTEESALGKLERAIGEEVNGVIEPVAPAAGASVKITNRTELPKTEEFKFADQATEARWQEASQGVQKEGLIAQVKESWQTLKNKATRTYEDLPNTAEFSQLKFDLLTLEKQRDVAGDRTARILQGITLKLDKPGLDLFTRKVILDDLAQQADKSLPFGFTPETLAKEKAAVDAVITANPEVGKAVETRKAAWDAMKMDYSEAMKSIGFDVADRLSREDYFRHQVLEYANARAVSGTGQKLKTPTGRGFLKQREGSAKDINANYLQAEFEVMAQMIYDTELAKTIKAVENNYSIRTKLQEQFGREWRDNIPDGYTTWQPREGSSFYMAKSIPENVAEQVLSGIMKEVGVSGDQIGQVLAKGAPFKELVVKQEVADTLNKISQPPSENVVAKISRGIIRPWKVWALMSPTRAIKYNLRNVTGDADALFAMNKSSFKQVPRAVNELYQTIYGDRSMTPEMGEWFRRGGMETTLNVQELPDVNKLRMFERFGDKDPNFIKKAWEGYWGTVRTATQFRESIFRYSTYLDYLKQMEKNGGKPNNFGASIPEEVMALTDIRDRAFKLSNEVLGAYDSVSVLGKDVRAHLYPFWSFTETNFVRYAQFLRNQKESGGLATALSRKLVGNVIIRSPYYAYAVGSFAVKAGAMWAALQTYNNLVFPNEEKDLPIEEQARPHIILGRDADGKVRYFNRLGSFSDFLEWFGLDTPVKDVKDFLDGTRSVKEIVQDMAKSPVNKVVQGVAPTIKTPGELLTGKRLFPDAFRPVSIRDRGQYIADSLGLGNEFKAISRTDAAQALGVKPRPGKSYLPELGDSLTHYKSDPGQTAYYKVKDMKHDFLEKEGKGGEGDFMSPKTEALRNYKIAIRYQDADSAAYYLSEYESLGGTKKGLKKSMEAMHPLAGLNAKDKNKFAAGLSEEERQELQRAVDYYKTVLHGK